MDKRVIGLLSALVVIGAIGIGLYAHELSRQAAERRAVVRAQKEADCNEAIQTFSKSIQTFCHPSNENVKADVNAKPNTPQWDKWQCENAKSELDWNSQRLKELEKEDRK